MAPKAPTVGCTFQFCEPITAPSGLVSNPRRTRGGGGRILSPSGDRMGRDAPQGRVFYEASGLQHNGEPEEEPRDQEDTQAGSKATVPASPGVAGH